MALPQVLLAGYLVIWLWLAIAPVDRRDWMLENILAVTFVTILVVTYRRFRFSDLSYVLLTAFLLLHAIGAHYTYSEVPLGFWLRDGLGLVRNHFDRFVHFAYGVLLVVPIREWLTRSAGVRGAWATALPVAVVLAQSGFFEVVEAVIAELVSPELGSAYLGTQGDEWDAQKDMGAAMAGAFVATILTAVTGFSVPEAPSRPPHLDPPSDEGAR